MVRYVVTGSRLASACVLPLCPVVLYVERGAHVRSGVVCIGGRRSRCAAAQGACVHSCSSLPSSEWCVITHPYVPSSLRTGVVVGPHTQPVPVSSWSMGSLLGSTCTVLIGPPTLGGCVVFP